MSSSKLWRNIYFFSFKCPLRLHFLKVFLCCFRHMLQKSLVKSITLLVFLLWGFCLSCMFILLLAMFTSSSLIFFLFFLACFSGKYIERYRTDNRSCYWRLSCSGSLHSKLCLHKFHIPYIFLIGLLGFCFMLLSLQRSILIYFHWIQFLEGNIFIIHSKMQFQMLAK